MSGWRSLMAARAQSMLSLPMPRPAPGEQPPTYRECDDEPDDTVIALIEA